MVERDLHEHLYIHRPAQISTGAEEREIGRGMSKTYNSSLLIIQDITKDHTFPTSNDRHSRHERRWEVQATRRRTTIRSDDVRFGQSPSWHVGWSVYEWVSCSGEEVDTVRIGVCGAVRCPAECAYMSEKNIWGKWRLRSRERKKGRVCTHKSALLLNGGPLYPNA